MIVEKSVTLILIFSIYIAAVALFSNFIKNLMGFKSKRAFWLLFLLNALLNVAGIVFTVLLYFYLNRNKKENGEIKAKEIDTDLLFLYYPKVRLDYRKGALDELLLNEKAEENRKVKILSYFKDNLKKDDMRFFHATLSSRSDESRLLSFGVINRLEKRLSDDINGILKKIKATEDKRELQKEYKNLAKLYFEYIYYDIAVGDLKNFYLKKGEEAAVEALKIDSEDEEVYMILGKIYLYKGEYEKAASYFENIEDSFLKKRALSYLCEIHFENRDFDKFKKSVKALNDIKYNPKILSLLSLWRDL